MAMIQCPECKKEISDQASSCPGCGFPILKVGTSSTARMQTFSKAITDKTSQGWQIASRDDNNYTAVFIVPASKVNHIMHLLLSVLFLGIWLIVWLLVVLTASKEKRIRMDVDENLKIIEYPADGIPLEITDVNKLIQSILDQRIDKYKKVGLLAGLRDKKALSSAEFEKYKTELLHK